MDKEPPQSSPEDHEEDNIVDFPTSEYMRTRQRHPAGRLGRKSVEETLRDIEQTEKSDDD